MTLEEAKNLAIPYYDLIHGYANLTTHYVPTMDYLNCFEVIKQGQPDADFNEFYNVFIESAVKPLALAMGI